MSHEKRAMSGATGLSEIKARIDAGRDRAAALKTARAASVSGQTRLTARQGCRRLR